MSAQPKHQYVATLHVQFLVAHSNNISSCHAEVVASLEPGALCTKYVTTQWLHNMYSQKTGVSTSTEVMIVSLRQALICANWGYACRAQRHVHKNPQVKGRPVPSELSVLRATEHESTESRPHHIVGVVRLRNIFSSSLQEGGPTAIHTPHGQLGLPQPVPAPHVVSSFMEIVWGQIQGCHLHAGIVVLQYTMSVTGNVATTICRRCFCCCLEAVVVRLP